MDAPKTVNLIRRIRHDFANDLQVILGYIDLNRPQEAKRYISEIIEEMAAQRTIFEKVEAEMALYFYQQMLLATELGVILRYEQIEIKTLNKLKELNEPYSSLASITGDFKYADDEPVIYLSLYEKDNTINMVFLCDRFEQNPVLRSIKE
ncbi:MAG: Spo0B domain-containing protein [Syntrophomonadaceae bacterium]|nr:Spo0B domain-containing protein [Syntrophomonadaceae bacterium]MDD3890535.1 Spo0B domain-containing protein [Syntrophomonadaceae bacterium]MDD4549599.1 Spo0B domain-containing protein [Syntrophomonadaceae bacterium]